ncbi:MAG: chemotaxis response regulator containing a CheY-like receiver domain and a methylesterase domain [bacterium]|nr:chemotaxis response regulator containing a CheY-like receiver domain and a methylesterase domain [bacterium]
MRVVVVGTSMGGMHALEIVLRGLRPDFALPIAIVQHRGADASAQQSQLAGLLQLHCALPVVEANDKEPMSGGRVYLGPPDYHLLVDDGRFALSVDDRVSHARPSVDVLFESAADSYREGVLGIILTGDGGDGAHGATCIKRRGGMVIAQDPRTAEAPSMPQRAIAAGAVDHVLPLADIAPYLNLADVNHR